MFALAGLGREAEALELAAAAAAIRISASGPPGNWARHANEVVASCRQRLGNAAADAAWTRGKALQMDAAVARGLAV